MISFLSMSMWGTSYMCMRIMPLHIIQNKIHGRGHLLEIIHDLPQAKTRSLMLYFLYVVASLKTPPEFFLSFHVDLPILDWFTASLVHFCYLWCLLTHFTANYCWWAILGVWSYFFCYDTDKSWVLNVTSRKFVRCTENFYIKA